MAEIVLENVSKAYGGTRAVRELDLTVRDGELMVLVGPSGCGKTTTLRLVAGLETPEEGEIRIGGRVVNRLKPKKRNVAMIFQDFSLYPNLTARKNLVYALKLRRTPTKEAGNRLAWVVDVAGIREVLDRRPGEMSGGQRQRVAFAAALIRKPACQLFDEPLSNLDEAARRGLRGELKRLHRDSGATIIHVTHDQQEAMSLGQRLAVMRKGRIRQVGEPMELYRRPADRFVAGFIGSPPMNFIEGHLQTENGRVLFRDGYGIELGPPDHLLERLGQPRLREVVYGVRPEHLRLAGDQEAAEAVIAADVTLVEPLGDRMDIHVQAGGGVELVARVPAETCQPRVGESIRLAFDSEKAHLFEPGAAGWRISDGEEPAGG